MTSKNLNELKIGTIITRDMVFNWAAEQFGKKFTRIKMRDMRKEGKGLVEMWAWFNRFKQYVIEEENKK
jgi:hypothetical protein